MTVLVATAVNACSIDGCDEPSCASESEVYSYGLPLLCRAHYYERFGEDA